MATELSPALSSSPRDADSVLVDLADISLQQQNQHAQHNPRKARPLKSVIIDKPPSDHLPAHHRYGWSLDPSLSIDTNYMDLACLTARSSLSLKGHMGCVLVSPPTDANPWGSVLLTANNVPVFPVDEGKTLKSSTEIHAEANVVTQCARTGTASMGAWCYVTFPPCKDCFMLLVYAGVKRIVFRRWSVVPGMKEVADAWGIELVERGKVDDEDVHEDRKRGIVAEWEAAQAKA
ncbi:hypothetical protein HKX48_002674 [Thoreauomyces humboldtii]|nr:hypothetical protein HKX48_002674 [Thoreauomyces humboldtii]